jgi:5-methylcytosine-specific restriction endonuclease McrA
MLRRRPRVLDPQRIDYSLFAIKKPEPRAVVKARHDRRVVRHGTSVKRHVIRRQRGICWFKPVSPICQVAIRDRHELIPKSQGGEVTIENCVGACRACHDAFHGTPGHGRRLKAGWRGAAPNAETGNAWPVWLGKR